MADFCRQCAMGLFPHGEDLDHDSTAEDTDQYLKDLANISTPEDTAKGMYAVVLCEGCGPCQVDHTGRCVSSDCLEKHGKGLDTCS